MSAIPGVAPLELLPNRLEIADFTPFEMGIVLGESADRELSRDNFNWVGAFLVEQVGLHEDEVTEWFRSGSQTLGGKRPLDIWGEIEGFGVAFEYAKAYKESVAADLSSEVTGDSRADDFNRSQGIAESALRIIDRAFQIVERSAPYLGSSGPNNALHVRSKSAPEEGMLRWRGGATLEEYRIQQLDGDYLRQYYIIRYLEEDTPIVAQSGILESFKGKHIDSSSDSDFDGYAPSAGEVASFIVPLASQIKAGTLVLADA